MSQEEFLEQIREYSNQHHELSWFIAEVSFYAAAGGVLDILKNHLRLGCGIDRESVLHALGELLRRLADLCVCTMSHSEFTNHNWHLSREMVPAGVNGCANSILNMLRTPEMGKRIHFFANACSHLGLTFDVVSCQSLQNLKRGK